MDRTHPGYDKWREGIKKWQDDHPALVRAYRRAYYERTKLLGGPGVWTPTHDEQLKLRLARGQTFGQISKAMGISRSSIAGRVHRLRNSGEL